jgi:hypothetical protein
MRHHSSLALLDIPDLPIDAFRHVGDRKIKPQGAVSFFKNAVESTVKTVGQAVGQVAKGDIGGAISTVGSGIDKAVNTGIPGGWAGAAVLAGGAALASGALGGAAAGATGTAAGASGVLPAGASAGGSLFATGGGGAAYGGGLAGATTTGGMLSGALGASSLAGGGSSAATAAALGSQVASSGLIPSVVQSVADFTGLSPSVVGQLGVAGVQSLISGLGASQTAGQQQQAAQTAADAQVRAAQIAADAARFRPVGVTTRFGQSAFTTDAQGNVIGAGYTASPEIQGYQNRLSALANTGLTQAEQAPTAYAPLQTGAQSLFNLGQGYLAKSPEQAAQDYITKQQALLAPTQENQLALLQNKLFQQGRTGAAVAQGGNLMNTNPEMAAYYNALAQSNLQLSANADQAAKQNITYGGGLMTQGAGLQNAYYMGQTGAYAPFTTAMDTSTGLESLAQQPMTLGTQIGAKTTASTAQAGNLLSQGITGAAQTMYPSNAFSPSGNVLSGLSQSPVVTGALNNLFGVQPQQQTFTTQQVMNLLSGRGFVA